MRRGQASDGIAPQCIANICSADFAAVCTTIVRRRAIDRAILDRHHRTLARLRYRHFTCKRADSMMAKCLSIGGRRHEAERTGAKGERMICIRLYRMDDFDKYAEGLKCARTLETTATPYGVLARGDGTCSYGGPPIMLSYATSQRNARSAVLGHDRTACVMHASHSADICNER